MKNNQKRPRITILTYDTQNDLSCYDGWGDLIKSHLRVKSDEELVSIVAINTNDPIYDCSPWVTFDMKTNSAYAMDFAIGFLGFGLFHVNGLSFPVVVETTNNSMILMISRRTLRVLHSTFVLGLALHSTSGSNPVKDKLL